MSRGHIAWPNTSLEPTADAAPICMGMDSSMTVQVSSARLSRLWLSLKCFAPRHALRVAANGRTYDFLLCYACRKLSIIQDQTEIVRVGVGGTPDALNALLGAAKIPLAKPHED